MAAFAVNAIRRRYDVVGRDRYGRAERLLITADGGGYSGRPMRHCGGGACRSRRNRRRSGLCRCAGCARPACARFANSGPGRAGGSSRTPRAHRTAASVASSIRSETTVSDCDTSSSAIATAWSSASTSRHGGYRTPAETRRAAGSTIAPPHRPRRAPGRQSAAPAGRCAGPDRWHGCRCDAAPPPAGPRPPPPRARCQPASRDARAGRTPENTSAVPRPRTTCPGSTCTSANVALPLTVRIWPKPSQSSTTLHARRIARDGDADAVARPRRTRRHRSSRRDTSRWCSISRRSATAIRRAA